MDNGILKRIESWESRSFSNGGLKLEELLSSGFSGMIGSEMEWMFILNGRIIGYQGEKIQEFGKKDSNVYTAPHPALPILFYMQVSEKIGESMRYYTGEKSIEEIDSALKENKFTGYIELSDDVLSGDYYIVYHGGRSMDVAFIGNMDRLISEEESRRNIKSEIGIYQVNRVNIKPIDITIKDPEKKKAAEDVVESKNDKLEKKHAEIIENKELLTQSKGMGNDTIETAIELEKEENKFKNEAAWRASRVVPSIDPRRDGELVELLKKSTEWKTEDKNQYEKIQLNENVPSKKVEIEMEYITEKEEGYEKTVEEVEEMIESDAKEIVEEDTDRIIDHESENIELEGGENIIELISSDIESMKGNVSMEKKTVDADYAMRSAIVFIRYKNPSGPTIIKSLKKKEKIGKDAVNRNLNYGSNNQIQGINEGTTLVKGDNGEPEEFNEYLEKTTEMKFIKWLFGSLIYEVIETGNIKSMKLVYAAIPKVDRIRFRHKIEAKEKNGELRAYAFDIVMEDDAGNPLIVANMKKDSAEPTEISDVDMLVEGASRVSASVKSISAAFLVSSSFHSSEALTAADESMKKRFGSRKKENTKVKASRKNKYNLCLVECRKGERVCLKIPSLH